MTNYQIKPGDTLWALSRRFGTTVDGLLAANPSIKNRDLIYSGANLRVPGRGDDFERPRPQPVPPGDAPGPTPTSGTRGPNGSPYEIARKHLGENAATVKLESSDVGRAMADWVPNNVNCANFVSGTLVAAGQITQAQTSASVYGLMGNLDKDPQFRRVTLANARPGDVVSMKTPGGQHQVLFAGWKDGKPQFIGSNNVNPDGSQRVTQGGMNYPIMAIHQYVG